jgi:hypothetical protein
MNRDPILQLLAPLAWLFLAAFCVGFGGVLAISAPVFSRSQTVNVPRAASVPAPGGWDASKSI